MTAAARKSGATHVGWGHVQGDGRGSDADWSELMVAWCGEARDGRVEWGDIF
jgi:hypothetical protein